MKRCCSRTDPIREGGAEGNEDRHLPGRSCPLVVCKPGLVYAVSIGTSVMRIIGYFFVVFGLMAALPVVVWDVTSGHLYTPVAIFFTFLSAFVPVAVIAWANMEKDPDDPDVPFRLREDAMVRAAIFTGMAIGIAALLWLSL